MQVEVWTDLVCPWCYIGKRRFERALQTFEHRDQVQLVHRSFQLDPNAPLDRPEKQSEVLMRKYGLSEAQAREAVDRVERTAAGEGLEYHLQGGMSGNTLAAHQLVHLARARGVQDAVVERLYRAHFTEQRSIFDAGSLVTLVSEAGLDPDEARRVLFENTYAQAVKADARQAQELGSRGVPFFVIDGRYGISGAEAPEVFSKALAQAWAEGGSASH